MSGHTDKSAPRFTPNVREAAQNPIAASPLQNNTNFDIGRSENTQNVLNIQPVAATDSRAFDMSLRPFGGSHHAIGRTQRSRLYCMNSADPAAGVRQRMDGKALGVLPMSAIARPVCTIPAASFG